MFQKNTAGEARVGAMDGYNRMVFPHVRLFPHNISENSSYSLHSTITWTIAIIYIFFLPFKFSFRRQDLVVCLSVSHTQATPLVSETMCNGEMYVQRKQILILHQ